MPTIIASEYVSLDGMMDEPGHWSFPFFSDDLAQYKHEELFAADALLLGRVTYDGFSAAWPAMTDELGFADRMNSLPKYVASRTRTELDWNATVIQGDLGEAVAALKQQPGRSVLLAGSGQVFRTLVARGLVDEVRLLVHPIVLGQGTPLFAGVDRTTLTLTSTRTFEAGVVALHYSVASTT